MSRRRLRKGADALKAAAEPDQEAGVILGLATVNVANLGDHRLDLRAGDRLHEVEPMNADVGGGPRRAPARCIETPVLVGREEQPILKV